MPRKSSSKTTATKFTTVPPKAAPKAAEVAKPVASATPTITFTAEKAATANVADIKIETTHACTGATTATTTAAVATTECCHGSATEAAPATTVATGAVAAAIASLQDDNADIARDAATTLGQLSDRSAVEPLITALNNGCGFFHSVVRAAAAESLGKLGDDRAVEPLLSAITDPVAEVSSEAIRALSSFGNADVINALSDVVANRTNFFLPIARRTAVLSLVKIGGDRAAEILRSVAADEFEDSTIRDAAGNGLTEATASAK